MYTWFDYSINNYQIQAIWEEALISIFIECIVMRSVSGLCIPNENMRYNVYYAYETVDMNFINESKYAHK